MATRCSSRRSGPGVRTANRASPPATRNLRGENPPARRQRSRGVTPVRQRLVEHGAETPSPADAKGPLCADAETPSPAVLEVPSPAGAKSPLPRGCRSAFARQCRRLFPRQYRATLTHERGLTRLLRRRPTAAHRDQIPHNSLCLGALRVAPRSPRLSPIRRHTPPLFVRLGCRPHPHRLRQRRRQQPPPSDGGSTPPPTAAGQGAEGIEHRPGSSHLEESA